VTPTSQIAHFKITAKLGEGGMGAVYRATDTKLNREVAIKVLPDAFAADPDRLARFTREAQVLASLNHPNIAAIYGVEERAIVMELVEGNAPSGPMADEEALPLIEQLIDALEYAHEKGVVHRDLKPANLKLTPDRRLKVLDFGLAKALSSDRSTTSDNPAASPTLTMRATTVGAIMGTAAYMAPEQARGHNIDKRADIWSFGVVAYELLTGKQLFNGDSVSDTLAAVLRQDIDLEPAPLRFRKLLARCITRDPRERLRDISGARLLLEVESPQPAGPSPVVATRRALWPYAALAVVSVAALLLTAALWRAPRPAPPQALLRLDLVLDNSPLARTQNSSMIALSPDATHLALVFRSSDGKVRLGVRALDRKEITVLPDTENASAPFFSPDGKWIGFTAESKLKKVAIAGGNPVTMADNNFSFRGAAWGIDGSIYIPGPGTGGVIYRIPEGGGTPVPVTRFDGNEKTHRWPDLLPGEQALLFTAHDNTTAGSWDDAQVAVIRLKTGERKNLVRGFSGHYLPVTAGAGYLLYMLKDSLLAAPFNPDKLALTGPSVPVLPDVDSTVRGGGDFAFSSNGVFVYHAGRGSREWPILWLDSSGKMTPLHSTPGAYFDFRFSPDGKRLAFSTGNGHGAGIWIKDLERDNVSRLTVLPGTNYGLDWAPDGKSIFFSSRDQPSPGIYWIPADGSAESRLILSYQLLPGAVVNAVSADGKLLAVHATPTGRATSSIFIIPIEWDPAGRPQAGKPEPFATTPFNETDPTFSPDGRWLAYESSETGEDEIYVRPFPGPGGRSQVSNGSGALPIWSRIAHELFFRDNDQRLMVVDWSADSGGFHAGKPRPWLASQIRTINLATLWTFALAPDGKRMAFVPASVPGVGDAASNNLTFLVNFADELRRRVPEGK
jgi:serine/threonine-protein kinase